MENRKYRDVQGELFVLKAVLNDPKLINTYNLTANSFNMDNVTIFNIINSRYIKGTGLDAVLIKKDCLAKSPELAELFGGINSLQLKAKPTEEIEMIKKMELLHKLDSNGFTSAVKEFFNPGVDFLELGKEWDKLKNTPIENILKKVSGFISGLESEYTFQNEVIRSIDDMDQAIADRKKAFENALSIPEYDLKLIPGKVNLIAASTGVGKTTYLQSIAVSLQTSQKSKVLYLSLEQDEEDIAMGIQDIIDGEYMLDVLTAKEIKRNIFIKYIGAGKVSEVKDSFSKILRDNYNFIIIDYIKPATILDEGNGWDKMSKFMTMLNQLIIEFTPNAIIFAAVQGNTQSINKSVEDLVNNPAESIAEGSRTLESCANAVFLQLDKSGSRKAIVVKSRNENTKKGNYSELVYSPNKIIKLKNSSNIYNEYLAAGSMQKSAKENTQKVDKANKGSLKL